MKNILVYRHYLKIMIEIQKTATALDLPATDLIYHDIDSYTPSLLVDYRQLRLVPFFIVITLAMEGG